MNHVIEHLFDPVATLRELFRILRPDGKMVIITPNFEGLGARIFGGDWRGWEIPGHLYLHSEFALRVCAGKAGLRILNIRTTARSARYIWAASRLIRRNSKHSGRQLHKHNLWLKFEPLIFWIIESMFRRSGEKLVVVAPQRERNPGKNKWTTYTRISILGWNDKAFVSLTGRK